jgi:hypothetical protein
MVSLGILWTLQSFLPPEEKLSGMLAGISGLMLFVLIRSVSGLFEEEEKEEAVAHATQRAGVMGFLYLEVLDASFSFDGVIGAFAITKDVIIIMLGLAIGAMFVRSITVYMVRKETLEEYIFLEHGAHYAIGALAFIMLIGTKIDIPEVITGLIGAAFIGLSLFSSIRHGKKNRIKKHLSQEKKI